MKIIIVENELYLAQSIASKLNEAGFETEIFSSVKEAMNTNGDVYLLSTNLPGQNTGPLITKFKEKIIILMVSYINNDTVSEPLRLGAKDYIVKPFMIEELVRKIDHFQEYQQLKQRINLYEEYIDNFLREITLEENIDLTTPVVIETNYQRLVDKVVFQHAKERNKSLTFVPLSDKKWKEKIESSDAKSLLYITEVHTLKKAEKEQLLGILADYDFILSCTSALESNFNTVTLTTDSKLYDQNEILTIDDYVKFIVNSFQYKFPDTELSKKLGISRKSLWEKRKKYGLFKNK
ncbi:response regulator [Sulfurovum sp.]|jgi:DNA-binding response OmpR family regulator|uniref:response regulator n=1 Tax=Sulfurovum sp. TaxID=1969726 RepID=UPI002A36BA84|nr:response regulator [Sulfurovum sp.]MDD2452199.1 response regulator [Sulfurovum sp.]MDD3500549.1 response regulator [Sulfurovum sp.]MDY0403885.1 response regulator [Sulfurovum sp.]